MMRRVYDAFDAHAQVEAPREACGLMLRVKSEDTYWPCTNLSDSGDHFTLDPQDYAEAANYGEIKAICHSHPGAPPEPSQADLVGCRVGGLPWFILQPETGALQRIDCDLKPLQGRVFDYGALDCWSLVRDWMLAMRGIRLRDFPRVEKFWEQGQSPYVQNAPAWGFHEVHRDQILPGDVLLMRVKASVPNHAAVYLGGEKILHHLWGQLSREDHLLRYRHLITHAWRLA